jgi:ketosteroid isomerase-like protein
VTATAEPPPPPPPAPKPTLAELIPQTLKGIEDAFNAHDAKKLAGYHTQDCEVVEYGDPMPAHGRDDIEKRLQGMFDGIPDAKTAATRVWIKGNVAIQELVWAGTMSSDLMGMKATKKPVGGYRIHVAWFSDDGLVKEVHQYADGGALMAQMQGKPNAPPVPAIPTNPPEVHVSKGSPDEDKLVDWLKSVDDTFDKDDVKAAIAIHADDCEVWMGPGGRPSMKGKKEVTKALTDWFKTFPDQKWSNANAWGIDGFTIAEKTMSGTQKGKLGPLPASNKPVSWHWLEILQPNSDGKVEHAWLFANVVEVMAETGALKGMGPKGGHDAKPVDAPKAAAPKAN